MAAVDAAAEIEKALADADIKVDVGRFVSLVRDALRGGRRRRAEVDPRTQLTGDELSELSKGGLSPTRDRSAADRVRIRTAADTAALLATALTTADAARRLGVDPSRIRQMLNEHQLIATKDGGEWRILELQFADGRLVPNIGVVARALPHGLPLVGVATWLTTPEADLEIAGEAVSPLAWLEGGGDPNVLAELAGAL